MKNDHNPKPSAIAKRFRFNERGRKQGEHCRVVAITKFCDYGISLEQMLHNRLVCGVQNKHIQQRLLVSVIRLH